MAEKREHHSFLQVLPAAVWGLLVPSLVFWRLLPPGPLLKYSSAGLHSCFRLLQTPVKSLLDPLVLTISSPQDSGTCSGGLEKEKIPEVPNEPSPDAGLLSLSHVCVKKCLCPKG